MKQDITFKQLAEEWLQFKRMCVKESTYLNYKLMIRTKLLNVIGDKTLEELLKYNFNNLIENLMLDLSNKSVKDIVVLLKSILKYGELKYGYNYKLVLISAPQTVKQKVEIMEERSRKRLERYCIASGDDTAIGILISLYTGMRIGEICALKWGDIDFVNRSINVTHTVQRVYIGEKQSKIVYTTPKTPSSIRQIPIAKVLHDKLKQLSYKHSENDFVVPGIKKEWNEPLSYRYLYKKILKKCRVKYKRYHILRHTFATRCIKVGMDVKSLSEVLGHSNVAITLNIYVHSSFAQKNRFINKL